MMEFWGLILCKSCAGNHSYCELICTTAMSKLSPSASFYVLLATFLEVPWALDGKSWFRRFIYKWTLKVTYTYHFDHGSFFFLLLQKKLLWQRLRATHIYKYKHKWLEYSVIEWQLSRATAMVIPRAYGLILMGCWPGGSTQYGTLPVVQAL